MQFWHFRGKMQGKKQKSKSSAVLLAALFLLLSACNHYGLVDKLENPGGAGGGKTGEQFVPHNYVFVSSWTSMGDMSGQPFSECGVLTGVARADCACTQAAAVHGLRKNANHQFRAWLSTSSADAKCRVLGQANGCNTNIAEGWYNTMGELIVTNFDNFVNGGSLLLNAIRYSESRIDSSPDLIWTGTNSFGIIISGSACGDWTSTALNGALGNRLGISGGSWTQNVSPSTEVCSTTQRIYCFAMP